MLKSIAVGLALLMPLAAAAKENTVFAIYVEDSGQVAPESAWHMEATIWNHGQIDLTFCLGGATSGPDCATVKGKTVRLSASDALAQKIAIAIAVTSDNPIKARSNPPGGQAWRSADVGSGTSGYTIPAFPIKSDQARANSVLDQLAAMIPPALRDQAEERAKAAQE